MNKLEFTAILEYYPINEDGNIWDVCDITKFVEALNSDTLELYSADTHKILGKVTLMT